VVANDEPTAREIVDAYPGLAIARMPRS